MPTTITAIPACAAAFLLAASALLSPAVADHTPCANDGIPPVAASQEYVDLACEAEKQIRLGNLDAARDAVFAALSVQLFEVPNYETIVSLAEIECLRGATDEGLALLRDFECMLDIEVGIRQCYMPSEDRSRLGPTPGDVSPLCFQKMCGEIYLSYYDNPSTATKEWVATLHGELDRVREICIGLD